jgi:hypothetical protein
VFIYQWTFWPIIFKLQILFWSLCFSDFSWDIAWFELSSITLWKETNKWQTKFESVSKTLDETTIKLDEVKSKLSKYNTRNVNKRQKRLENKFLKTLTEIQELKNQCEQKCFSWIWFRTFKEVVIKFSKLSIWIFNSFILF